MDWDLYMQHLISGYIPAIPMLLIYFFVLYIKGKKQTLSHIILSFVFICYLFGILTMTGVWWFKPFWSCIIKVQSKNSQLSDILQI